MKVKCDGKVKAEQPDATACIPSSTEYDEVDQSILPNSVTLSSRSLSRSSRFLSRFGLFPSNNTSFKLSRATSVGSSRAYSVTATSFTIPNEQDQLDPHTGPSLGLVNRNEPSRGRNFLPACLVTRSPPSQFDDFASGSLESNPMPSAYFDNLQDDHIAPPLNVARDIENPRGESNVNSGSSRNDVTESMETRIGDRRMERNVRFSRTLSVGRLRDRVLRRSAFPDFTFSPLEQEREVRDARLQGGMQALGGGSGAPSSNGNGLISSSSSVSASTGMPSSFYSSQDSEVETFRARETRYHDLLEHRSNFLERRRRIRSRVCKFSALANYKSVICNFLISEFYKNIAYSLSIGQWHRTTFTLAYLDSLVSLWFTFRFSLFFDRRCLSQIHVYSIPAVWLHKGQAKHVLPIKKKKKTHDFCLKCA